MTTALALPLADTWDMHNGVGTGWGILMMVGMVLFWGAVLLGLVWLVRAAVRGWSPPGETLAREAPVDVLERRFAEGAISVEEYRAHREVLVGGPQAPGGR